MSGEPPSAPQHSGGYGAWGPPPPPPPPPPPRPPKPPPSWRSPGVWISVGIAVLVLIFVISSEGGGGQQTGPVVVEVVAPADLCWSGAFGDRTVDGCGNQTVPLEDTGGVYAANAQKQDDSSGELVLVLTAGGRVLDTTSTSAAYGLASVQGHP